MPWQRYFLSLSGDADGTGLQVPCQAERSECCDGVPVQIEFVPNQAVTAGLRMCVVVVVPTLAEGQKSDPKAIR